MSLPVKEASERASCSKKNFPKSARLLRRDAFIQLQRHAFRLHGKYVGLQYRRGLSTAPTRLGITVSKKFGKAHDRNRFKRLIREAFRSLYPQIGPGLEVNVYPHKPLNSFACALTELSELFAKI